MPLRHHFSELRASSWLFETATRKPPTSPTRLRDSSSNTDLADLDATIERLQAELSTLLAQPTRTDAEDERLGVVEERLVTFNQARATMLEDMSQGSPKRGLERATIAAALSLTRRPPRPNRALA